MSPWTSRLPRTRFVPAEAPAPPKAQRGALRWIVRGAGILVAAGFLALLAYGRPTKDSDRRIDAARAREQAGPAPNFKLDALQRGIGGPPSLAVATADGRL